MDELRSREDATPVDVTTLEEEVGRYTEQLEDLAGRKTKLEGEMAAARSELEAAEDEYKHIDGQIKSVTTKFDEIKVRHIFSVLRTSHYLQKWHDILDIYRASNSSGQYDCMAGA